MTGEIKAIPDGDLVTPPKLARDAPWLDVFQPVEIDLLVLLGQDLGCAVTDGVERRADNFVGINKPLVGEHGLDHHFGAISKGLHDFLGFNQRDQILGSFVGADSAAQARVACMGRDREAFGRDLIHDASPRDEPVQAADVVGDKIDGVCFSLGQCLFAARNGKRDLGGFGIRHAVVTHGAFGVHEAVHRDAAALGDHVVVEVVRAGDFHRAGAEVGVGVFVGDDRDQAAVFFRANRDFT